LILDLFVDYILLQVSRKKSLMPLVQLLKKKSKIFHIIMIHTKKSKTKITLSQID